jgi:lysophospholipase L1-like esterase
MTGRGITHAILALVLLVLLGLSARVPAQAATQHHAARPVYVALGDSLTAGDGTGDPATQSYPALLARHLPRGAGFYNLGSEGNTLDAALLLDLPATLAERPTLVTVWLGVNDLMEGTPPATFRTDLDHLLTTLQRTHTRVFIANMPDLRHVPASYFAFFDGVLGGGSRTAAAYAPVGRAYNSALAAVAARHGATVVDIYAATNSLWGRPELVSDGVHLNAQGYTILAHLFYGVMHAHGAI